jgi:lysozyme
MIRKPIFDAVVAARGKGFVQTEVVDLDAALDKLGVPRDEPAQQRATSAGLDIIKRFEGLRLKAYQDTGKVWTIGYGHTGAHAKPGNVITEAQADALLVADVAEAEAAVRKLFPVTTQNQFDALVSFAFNLGEGQVSGSTLRTKHNAKDYAGAANEFARWRFDNKVELAGLVKRRAAEAALYRRAA